MKQCIILCFSCFLSCFSSCQRYDSQLEEALILAKENRGELEKALAFYEKDSLKLEAAKFLIKNMPGHYSYREVDSVEKYYDAVDSVLKYVQSSREEIRDTLEKVSQHFAMNYYTIPDVEIIRSDFLIANIEKAFSQWKEGEWATHVSFQDFCEYLLPYKAVELQPFDSWRDSAGIKYSKGLDELQYCEAYRGSAVWATHRVNNQLREDVHPYLLDYNMYPIHRLRTKTKLPFGVCEDYVEMATRTPFIKDVTAEYMATCDVDIKIDSEHSKYVYLAVFNNPSWIPIAFAKVKNHIAQFKKLGKNVLYLPVSYTEYGIQPVGNPFILTSKGKVTTIIPNKKVLQSMTLYRKYPLFKHVQDIAYRILGAKFQAANKPTFEDSVSIYRIDKWGTRGEEINIPPLGNKYRYWRLFQPEWSHCNVAEITFVERDSHLRNQGKVIGLPRSWNNDPNTYKEAAFDGDLLTFFDSALPAGGWVGMDFGHPVDIEKIIYTPRGDGNTIGIGDEYELFYWTDHHWASLGKQIATTIKLEYTEVPSGGLYFLRNLTRGKEERIFTYVDGEQVFW